MPCKKIVVPDEGRNSAGSSPGGTGLLNQRNAIIAGVALAGIGLLASRQ